MAKEQKIYWKICEDGHFELIWEGRAVLGAHARAYHTDGRMIDTQKAALKEKNARADGWDLIFAAENGLVLREELRVEEQKIPTARCILSEPGKEVETSRLIPLIFHGPENNTTGIWKGLWTRMLLVPYDNTMWTRYEALPFCPGRRSYDLTVLFREDSREGLCVGATEFSVWKNAVTCSGSDANTYLAECGVADKGTHDFLPHGTIKGACVASSPFCVLYGKDYRRILEEYGDLLSKDRMLTWEQGVPFGFNSWAGLEFRLNEENFRSSGRFLREVLRPAGYENNGVSYVNLDHGWEGMSPAVLRSFAEELHENGQKAGIYDAPFACFEEAFDKELPGVAGHCFREILLRDSRGELLTRLDGSYPLDVTHPLWKRQMAWKLKQFADWGYDYLKMDFLSHGALEGCHYDPDVRTGRQAIAIGYRWIAEHLSEKQIGRKFFISLSIAPLFPHGYGHARRSCCDAFGTNEDVEYVLNASTYAWWQHGRLYSFNDPDHICLLRSFCMERDSTPGEARARYTASAAAGTVMMLSDDYERPEARERAAILTSNREINAIARSGVAFCPCFSNGSSASCAYTAQIQGKHYLAIFHWVPEKEIVEVNCAGAGLPAGVKCKELWSGRVLSDQNGMLRWQADGCDAIVLKEVPTEGIPENNAAETEDREEKNGQKTDFQTN